MRIRQLSCFKHILWEPTKGDLQHFGAAMLIGFAILGSIVALRSQGVTPAVWLLWIAGCVLAFASLIPGLGRVSYFAVNIAAGIVGFVISRIALTLMFFLVFTPIAIALRMKGKDLLQLRPRSRGWIQLSGSHSNYYRQF